MCGGGEVSVCLSVCVCVCLCDSVCMFARVCMCVGGGVVRACVRISVHVRERERERERERKSAIMTGRLNILKDSSSFRIAVVVSVEVTGSFSCLNFKCSVRDAIFHHCIATISCVVC